MSGQEIAAILAGIAGVLAALAEHWRTRSIREDLARLSERVAYLEGKVGR